jgi:hypothetical protein
MCRAIVSSMLEHQYYYTSATAPAQLHNCSSSVPTCTLKPFAVQSAMALSSSSALRLHVKTYTSRSGFRHGCRGPLEDARVWNPTSW